MKKIFFVAKLVALIISIVAPLLGYMLFCIGMAVSVIVGPQVGTRWLMVALGFMSLGSLTFLGWRDK